RGASKSACPYVMAQHDYGLCARRRGILRHESASHGCLHAQHPEVVAANKTPRHGPAIGEVPDCRRRYDLRKDARVRAKVLDLRPAKALESTALGFPLKFIKAVRVPDSERPKHIRFKHCEQ